MTELNVAAEREESAYRLMIDLGKFVPTLKFDTGAKYTVISVGELSDGLSSEDLTRFKDYCESKRAPKEQFISASGDPFYGYLVSAHDAIVGGTTLSDFRYYLIIENKRDIALLGFDFIDRCSFKHTSKDDILLTEFDDQGYGAADGAIDSDELIAFIDSLS